LVLGDDKELSKYEQTQIGKLRPFIAIHNYNTITASLSSPQASTTRIVEFHVEGLILSFALTFFKQM